MTKYPDLIRGLKQGTLLPLYLFYGEEEFLVQETLDLIINRLVDPGTRDFNFNMLYCRDTAGAEIVNLAQTLPLMSEKRLIIASEIDALKAADIDELVRYLQDPSPNTCLVMVSHAGRYEKKPVISAVEAHGVVTRFFPLLEREILAWIEGWARKRGLSLQRDVAQYFFQTLGNDLQAIKNELEKVELFVKERKSVTFEDVKTVIGDFREYTSFDLAAAIGQKNRGKAFLILSRLLREGEQPVGLLGGIAWNFRRLLKAKAMEAAGIGQEQIKQKLNVIFHQAASFQEQMRCFSMEELSRSFEIMLNADRTLKSSGFSGRLILERMIIKLCNG